MLVEGLFMLKKLFIALILFLVMIFCSCQSQENYAWAKYDEKELLEIFKNNKDSFDDICSIIFDNEQFWDKARRDNEAGHAWIMSPMETNKLDLFNENDRKEIIDFFAKYKPYMVSLDYNSYISITFIGKNNVEGICFMKFADPNDSFREEERFYFEQNYTVYQLEDWDCRINYSSEDNKITTED